MQTPLPAGLTALLAALFLLPSAPHREALAAPEAPAVVLRTLEVSQIKGVLIGLDAQHVTLKDASGTPRRVALTSAIALDLPASAPRRRGGPRFRAWLTGGSQLAGRLLGGRADVIQLGSESLGEVGLLLDHIRTLEALPAGDERCHDLAAKHPRPEKDDLAYDTDGDEFRGAALEVDDEGVVVETQGGRERSVAWKSLRVLHLENDALPAPEGLRAEIELQDGSRLQTERAPVLEGTTLTFALRALPKEVLRVDLTQVRHIRWRGGQFVYASDLPFESTHRMFHETPAAMTYPAFLKRWFGARVDRRASGCPLRMGGTLFRHGFGVNSESKLTIPLDGKFASFQTWFGIDDEVLAEAAGSTARGNVSARILADGKVLWEAKDVVGGKAPRRVGPLDVSGAQVLVLEVGFGAERMTLDRADWGEPMLLKTSSPSKNTK